MAAASFERGRDCGWWRVGSRGTGFREQVQELDKLAVAEVMKMMPFAMFVAALLRVRIKCTVGYHGMPTKRPLFASFFPQHVNCHPGRPGYKYVCF